MPSYRRSGSIYSVTVEASLAPGGIVNEEARVSAGRRNCTRRSCLNGTVLELKRLLPPISKSTMCDPPPRDTQQPPSYGLSWPAAATMAGLGAAEMHGSVRPLARTIRELAASWHSSRHSLGMVASSRDGEVRRARTCRACVVLDHVVHACSMLRSSGLNK